VSQTKAQVDRPQQQARLHVIGSTVADAQIADVPYTPQSPPWLNPGDHHADRPPDAAPHHIRFGRRVADVGDPAKGIRHDTVAFVYGIAERRAGHTPSTKGHDQ
jgi:hypothetical protein